MVDNSLSVLESLTLLLHDIGAVQIGRFKLHSGKSSRIYLDLRLLVSYPAALREVTAVYRTMLDRLSFDILAATPLAGLPIGTALCLETDKPLIYPRKSSKKYGTGKEIEGKWKVGQRAVVVDDLVTSGDSILETIATIKSAGLSVKDAVVLIDREQGGAKTLQKEGYNLHAVITMRQILSILQDNERITAKQRNKILRSLYS